MYTQTSCKRRTPTISMTNSTSFTLQCVQTLLIIFNFIATIYRAYSNSQYSFLAFIFFIYFSAYLANNLSSTYRNIQSKNKSFEKSLLGFAIWFLYSSIIFGFVYQFYPFFGFWAGLPIHIVAIIISGVVFYDYVICDKQDGDNSHNFRYFGSSNDQMKRGYYCEEKWEVIWEKV